MVNTASGVFRCPSSQQGFSPFTTWPRGLAWALCGFSEQLEFLQTLAEPDLTSGSSSGASVALQILQSDQESDTTSSILNLLI